MHELLKGALDIAALGFPVFPCRPGSKKPYTENGFKNATTNAEQIKKWWVGNPEAWIGMPTEGYCVIDVDPMNDGSDNPWEPPEDLNTEVIQVTPRGGKHYFTVPSQSIRNSASKLADHVDIRADGGYVVVAPSPGYRFINKDGLEGDFCPLPESIEKAILKERREAYEAPDTIPQGLRDTALTRYLGAMRRFNASQDEMLAAAIVFNESRCDPPMAKAQVMKCVRSAGGFEEDAQETAHVECHWEQEDVPSEMSDPGPFPKKLLSIPGFVNDVIEYTLSVAPYPNRPLAFCGAVSALAQLTARKIRDDGDLRTNIYMVGLAYPGGGKEFPRRVNYAIMEAAGMDDTIYADFASGEGIEDKMKSKPAALFQPDEFDALLDRISKSTDGRQEYVSKIMLSMFTGSSSPWKCRVKAYNNRQTGNEIDTIHQPSLTLFATCTPTNFYAALSEKMLVGGLFARIIPVDAKVRSEGRKPGIIELPDPIKVVAKHWGKIPEGDIKWQDENILTDVTRPPKPYVVPYEDDADKYCEEVRVYADSMYNKAVEKGDAVEASIWSRAWEQTKKFALIYAASENYLTPQVTIKAVRWANEFVQHCIKRMLYMAEMYVANSAFHSEVQKFMRLYRENNCLISQRDMARGMRCEVAYLEKIYKFCGIAYGVTLKKLKPTLMSKRKSYHYCSQEMGNYGENSDD